MLDKYKNEQSIFYNVMSNAIFNDKISHAYLIDANNNTSAFDIVMSFVKEIICHDDNYLNSENICKRIDDGNYLDVKIIESDGIWIKKEQLLALQNEFSKKSIEGKRKIYVIKSAEKMNVQTSNSILKFLEEPIDNIIAILIVNNINLILPTIVSRCQIIKLNKSDFTDSSTDNFFNLIKYTKYKDISYEEQRKFVDKVIYFILQFEEMKIDTLIYTKKLWYSNFVSRDDIIMALDLMIYFYYDVIKDKSDLNVDFYKDKLSDVKMVASKNDILSLSRKLECLDKCRTNVRQNLNINLLVDKLIIDMCGDIK